MTGRERKAGGRKGGPRERQNPLQENILADTFARQNKQTEQKHECAAGLRVKLPLCGMGPSEDPGKMGRGRDPGTAPCLRTV